jgi:hypothetical protein
LLPFAFAALNVSHSRKPRLAESRCQLHQEAVFGCDDRPFDKLTSAPETGWSAQAITAASNADRVTSPEELLFGIPSPIGLGQHTVASTRPGSSISPEEWFSAIEAVPGIRHSQQSWVELFQGFAPKGTVFWSAVAKELHIRARHRDAYEAWQTALAYETPQERVDRCEMAQSLLDRVENEAEAEGTEPDYDHYFVDKALEMFAAGGCWQMVAHIHAERHAVGPMLVALLKAYAVDGSSWSQRDYDAPFDIVDMGELEPALQGNHEGLIHRFGPGYWRDVQSESVRQR